jgi:membrane-associated phospholipid phosphatase
MAQRLLLCGFMKPERPNRRVWRCTIAAGLLFATSAPASAQRTFGVIGRDIGYGIADIWFMWTSPFHADAGDWARALAVGGLSAGVSLADEDIDRWIVKHPLTGVVRAADPWREREELRLRDYGTAHGLVPLSGVLYATGFIFNSRGFREAGIGCLTAHEGNSLLRGLLYEAVARPRPSAPDPDPFEFDVPGGPWEQHSFFAGHAANAFACATFLSERFQLGVVEPLLYGFASGIAIARMVDRRHWASDTMIGVAVGYAMGRTVANRMERREARRKASEEPGAAPAEDRFSVQVAPQRGGVGVVGRWTFQ